MCCEREVRVRGSIGSDLHVSFYSLKLLNSEDRALLSATEDSSIARGATCVGPCAVATVTHDWLDPLDP